MNMKKIYYAAYNPIGEIVGLYNTEDHTFPNIPRPNIQLKESQYAALVRRPMDFSVNVSNVTLIDSGASLAAVEQNDVVVDSTRLKIAAGFIYKDVCYYADDAASANITQALAICAHDQNFEATLKVSNKGSITYKKVKRSALIEIAKGINALRSEL